MTFPRGPGRHTLLVGIVALSATAATVGGIALAIGPAGPAWRRAVAFAAAVCLPGAVAAWVLARLPARDPARAVAGPLAAMVVRILPPLAAMGWLSAGERPLRDAGGMEALVAFYLPLLAADILLTAVNGAAAARDAGRPH